MKTHIEKTVSHTPGPWEIQIRKYGLGCLPGGGVLEIVHNYPDGGGQQIIVGKHTGIDCLNPANARLIASAPAPASRHRGAGFFLPIRLQNGAIPGRKPPQRRSCRTDARRRVFHGSHGALSADRMPEITETPRPHPPCRALPPRGGAAASMCRNRCPTP